MFGGKNEDADFSFTGNYDIKNKNEENANLGIVYDGIM